MREIEVIQIILLLIFLRFVVEKVVHLHMTSMTTLATSSRSRQTPVSAIMFRVFFLRPCQNEAYDHSDQSHFHVFSIRRRGRKQRSRVHERMSGNNRGACWSNVCECISEFVINQKWKAYKSHPSRESRREM